MLFVLHRGPVEFARVFVVQVFVVAAVAAYNEAVVAVGVVGAVAWWSLLLPQQALEPVLAALMRVLELLLRVLGAAQVWVLPQLMLLEPGRLLVQASVWRCLPVVVGLFYGDYGAEAVVATMLLLAYYYCCY